MTFQQEFWAEQYLSGDTGWDVGYATPPLMNYIDQLPGKNIRILVPGAGYGWEVEYLHQQGFNHVYYLEFAPQPVADFVQRNPYFPKTNILQTNFFDLKMKFDLILEQTFFTAFEPALRINFVHKMHDLLNDGGKYAGVFFNHPFGNNFPPFSMHTHEYKELFSQKFDLITFDVCYNSIKPRQSRELFFIMRKK